MNKNAEENAMKQAGIELIKRAAREAGHASTPAVYAESASQFKITVLHEDAKGLMKHLPDFVLLFTLRSTVFTSLYVVRPLWSVQIWPKETCKTFTRKVFTGFDKAEVEEMAMRFIAKMHADISLVSYCVSVDNEVFFEPLVSFIPQTPKDFKRDMRTSIKVSHTTLSW